MAVIPRGLDDLLLDAYVTKLSAWRDAQVVMSAAVIFDVDRDRPEAWDTTRPLVNLTIAEDSYNSKGSASRTIRGARLSIKAECYAPKDKTRLPYLKHQAISGLFSLDAPHIETSIGASYFTLDGWPSWSPVSVTDLQSEEDLFVGVWSWSVLYAWAPDETDPPALSDISIDAANRWTALYHFV